MRFPEARPRPRWRALVASAALALAASGASAAPHVPERDDVVLERAAARALAPAPGEAPLAFARRAFALGQQGWDPRAVGRAEAALAPLLRGAEPPLEARLLRAAILQNRHEFEAALAELDGILALDRGAAAAWLLKASIELVRGEPAASLASCARALGGVDALVAATCAGQAVGRAGHARAAYTQMRRALDAAAAPPRPVELWTRLELADLAWRLGELEPAERELRAALELDPDDAAARALLADFLLERGRAGEARALFAEVPRADGLLLRLALAERALSDPAWREHLRALEARFAESRLRGGRAVHEREEARLALELAGDPARALALARANFTVQREPPDARALLEAALAAGAPEAAQPVLDWLARTRLEDVRLAPLAARLRAGQG